MNRHSAISARSPRGSTITCMVELLRTLLAQAGEHITLVLACMLLFAALDAALGIGAVLPGETGIVLAAITLSDRGELLAAGVFVAALGAFLGDHVGFEYRSEEHTSELQSRENLVCRLLLEKKKKKIKRSHLM